MNVLTTKRPLSGASSLLWRLRVGREAELYLQPPNIPERLEGVLDVLQPDKELACTLQLQIKGIAVQAGFQPAYNANLGTVQSNAQLYQCTELMNPFLVGSQQNVLVRLRQFLLPAFCAVRSNQSAQNQLAVGKPADRGIHQ